MKTHKEFIEKLKEKIKELKRGYGRTYGYPKDGREDE